MTNTNDESEIGTMQMDQEDYQDIANQLIRFRLELGGQHLLDLAGRVYLTHGPFELEWYHLEPEDWYFGEEHP